MTTVIRHLRENPAKCSLAGLEGRSDLRFLTFDPGDPHWKLLAWGKGPSVTAFDAEHPPAFAGHVWLRLDAPPLTLDDADRPLLLLDGTWRLAGNMAEHMKAPLASTIPRSLPTGLRTAYPRRQMDAGDPEAGLASVEALYAALHALGRDTDGLLERYRWATPFLDTNAAWFTAHP